MKFGEGIFTLFKACTVRQGLTRQDNTWPARFYEEPLPEGPDARAGLSKDTIEQLLDEYYELRGWDKKSGVPTIFTGGKASTTRLGDGNQKA